MPRRERPEGAIDFILYGDEAALIYGLLRAALSNISEEDIRISTSWLNGSPEGREAGKEEVKKAIDHTLCIVVGLCDDLKKHLGFETIEVLDKSLESGKFAFDADQSIKELLGTPEPPYRPADLNKYKPLDGPLDDLDI